MTEQYDTVKEIQEVASQLVNNGNPELARKLLTIYGSDTAQTWHDEWLDLGDQLLGRYMWGNKNMSIQRYSEWWQGIMNSSPRAE